jgi:hypothetical protein
MGLFLQETSFFLTSSRPISSYTYQRARPEMLTWLNCSTKSTHELRVGLDNKIKEAAFGSNGSWLCAWALGADQHCPSRSYFWGVENWPQDPSERQVGIQSLKGEHDTVRRHLRTSLTRI